MSGWGGWQRRVLGGEGSRWARRAYLEQEFVPIYSMKSSPLSYGSAVRLPWSIFRLSPRREKPTLARLRLATEVEVDADAEVDAEVTPRSRSTPRKVPSAVTGSP